MTQLSFFDLIAPVEASVFFDSYWQRRHLRSLPAQGARDLVSLADVEYLISSLASPDTNWIKVTRPGSAVPPAALVTQQGHLGLAKVYDAYRAGYTIQLAKLHKRWPAIGRLCREVERSLTELGVALAGRVGAHLHLTPPGGASRGPHYHTHDNLVVQVAGRKRWSLRAAIEPPPIEPLAGDLPRDRLPAPEEELWLEAGQALYVPRGTVHEAQAGDEHALHVTLDVTPSTWADLFSRLILEHPRLREALPAGAWRDGRPSPELEQGYRERCEQLGREGADLERAASLLLIRFLDDVDALPSRGFDELHLLGEVGLETVVRRRPGAFARVVPDGAGSRFLFPGAALRGPEVLRDVLEAVASTPSFAVRDLPDTLTDQSKIDIVKELIRQGFLETAGDAGPARPASGAR